MYKKIIFVVIVILVLIRGIYGIYNIITDKKESNDNKITFYELKTSEYFPDINNGKYYINSLEELNNFYSLYSDILNINVNYLNDNSLFINTIEVSSGSISIKLRDVNLDNNKVNFVINREVPEVGTDDMAFWYLVAIIPNDMLNGVNISDWNKPSLIVNKNYLDK